MTSASDSALVRSQALELLLHVERDHAFLSEEIDAAIQRNGFSPADAALLTQLAYGVTRERARLRAIVQPYLSNSKKTPLWMQLLLDLAIYQLLFLEKVPAYAAVDQAVRIAKRKAGAWGGNFMNAVLRRLQRENIVVEDALPSKSKALDSSQSLQNYFSIPAWLVERWRRETSPERLLARLQAFQKIPSLWLRVNERRQAFGEWTAEVERQGGKVSFQEAPMFSLAEMPWTQIQAWVGQGRVSIQDAASYRVVKVLEPKPGDCGIDVCAGHGGKLSAVVEKISSAENIYFHDIYPVKVQQLKDNFSRLRLPTPQFLNLELAREKALTFDWLLIDAPCSGSGTLGRKPEIRWRLKLEDVRRLSEIQFEILRSWNTFLKPGGKLLYSVCSLEVEEGRGQVERFLEAYPEFSVEAVQLLEPGTVGEDGFFYALLRKNFKGSALSEAKPSLY